MNKYTYDEISVGQKECFDIEITGEMLDAFKGITGDVNPLHTDEAYAISCGYDGRVAYGMLTASFMSTLAGVYMPGEKSLIKETHIKFAKPVFPGDVVSVEGEVTEKNDTFNMIVLKVTMRNDKCEKVLRGSMDIMVR
ncbi:MAG: MaoC family dehydratase N-terminal domain-containing protein [Lachnospiraceae bacterium]|nr:MaoC family dehydratase N-terminal domain-containing protein [Lachnospiraceae bacterium]